MDQPEHNDEKIEKVLEVPEVKIKKEPSKPTCPICKDEHPIETVLEKKVALSIRVGEDERIFKLSLFICSKCKTYFVW